MITPDEIVSKKIGKAFFGYDEQEVDYFLDEIILDIIRRDKEIDELQVKLRQLEKEEQGCIERAAREDENRSCRNAIHLEEDELSAMVDESLAQNKGIMNESRPVHRDFEKRIRELGLFFD